MSGSNIFVMYVFSLWTAKYLADTCNRRQLEQAERFRRDFSVQVSSLTIKIGTLQATAKMLQCRHALEQAMWNLSMTPAHRSKSSKVQE